MRAGGESRHLAAISPAGCREAGPASGRQLSLRYEMALFCASAIVAMNTTGVYLA